MNCKDCKNYEPKSELELQKGFDTVFRALKTETECCGVNCNDCAFAMSSNTCVAIKMLDLMREASGYKKDC